MKRENLVRFGIFLFFATTVFFANGMVVAEMDHSSHGMDNEPGPGMDYGASDEMEEGGHMGQDMKGAEETDHPGDGTGDGMGDGMTHDMKESVDPDTSAHTAHAANAANDTTAMDVKMGKMVYEMSCVLCHGKTGEGDGPAAIYIGTYSHPRPANFTVGSFKFRTTVTGELPTLKGLARTISHGIPGYMPSFKLMGDEKIRQVALYITSAFVGEELPEKSTLHLPSYPGGPTRESIARGREVYVSKKCFECHGMDGRGVTDDRMKDYQHLPIKPMDLTMPSTFGGGDSPEDIYRTIITGLDSTPMPSYEEAFKGEEAGLWDLVDYVLSLGERS